MYEMICTRPDLAYPISLLNRFMADHGKVHWEALKWVLRYIKGSLSYDIMYGNATRDLEYALLGYSYSDYVRCIDTRKFISGYMFIIFTSIMS